ncbi:MAG: IS630 family transposase [Thermoplasmata archaeon]|nr:IS630 family transposase [Thermoplasmata archaeon]
MSPVSAREERRRLAYRWLRRGVPKAEIARRLEVAYKTVWAWEKRQRTQGPRSWREANHPGGPRKIDEKQRKRLREILLEGALAHGYPTDLWTLKRVAEVIATEFGEQYTESGVWHVLRDLGLSAQVPVPRAFERDEKYIRHWRRIEWPRIVTEARRTRATLLFLDESSAQSEPNVRRTWWIEGERPEIQTRQGKRMKISLISAVGVRGQLYFRLSETDKNFDGGGVIEFLRYLLKEVRGRVLLLWDNGTIHRRKDVKAFLWEMRKRLKTRRFPAYAPELNPDEMVWNALKYQRLPNFCPKSEEEIREGVERELRWLQGHPDFLARCVQHAEIPLPR